MTGESTREERAGTGGDGRPIRRRRVLYVAGVVSTAGLAGCSDSADEGAGGDGSDDGNGGDDGDDGSPDEDEGGDEDGEETYDIHEHGTLVVEIDGEPVDFSREKYVYPDSHPNPDLPPFHFHDESEEDRWHMESEERLTFGRALNEIPDTSYEQGSGGHVFSIEGQTYDEGAGASVEMLANDESVDPLQYEIQDGDDLRVEVET